MENYLTWIIVFSVNFVTYFIARFAIISRGTLKMKIYLFGLFLYLFSYIIAFFLLELKTFFLFILLSYFVIRLLVIVVIDWLENIMFPYRKQAIEKKAKELNMHPEDLKEDMYINSFHEND